MSATALNDRRDPVADLSVASTEAGDGPPIVLVHGLAEARSTWQRQQRDLGDCRTYAYDMRGHGGTDLGDADGSLRQLGGDLVGYLETVVGGPAVCVGFSLGGTVVLSAAADRPELVSRAIVLGTSSVVGRGAVAFYDQRIALAETGDDDAMTSALREDTAAGFAGPRDDLDAVTAARIAAIGDRRGYINAAAAMRALGDAPLTPRLADVRCHVDVIGGERDAFCPRKAADILVAALPSATYHEIAHVGHLMNVEAPDDVTALLKTLIHEGDLP